MPTWIYPRLKDEKSFSIVQHSDLLRSLVTAIGAVKNTRASTIAFHLENMEGIIERAWKDRIFPSSIAHETLLAEFAGYREDRETWRIAEQRWDQVCKKYPAAADHFRLDTYYEY